MLPDDEEAKRFMDLGADSFHFSGVVTFKEGRYADGSWPSLDKILVETIAPYLQQFLSGAGEIKQPYTRYVIGSCCNTTWLDNRKKVAQAAYDNAERYLALTEKEKYRRLLKARGYYGNQKHIMRWIPETRGSAN